MKKYSIRLISLFSALCSLITPITIQANDELKEKSTAKDDVQNKESVKPEKCKDSKTTDADDPLVPPNQDEDDDEIASRDRYDIYDRNRDKGDWDVRDNWRYQQDAYFDGNTKLNQMGPRYAPNNDDDNYNNRNRGW